MEIDSNQLLNILSLCVALLAVIVGPIVAWVVSKRQSETSLHIANKQIIAPIKKEWVELLQNHVAEILSTSLWYYVSGQDEEIISGVDEEEHDNQSLKVERKLLFIMSQVELMLNPIDTDHVLLLESLKATQFSIWPHTEEHTKFPSYHQETVKICQKVIKKELERVQSEIQKI